MNTEDGEALKILTPVNRLCAQVKRLFAVHLRIHRKNVQLWLSEKAFRIENGCGLAFGKIYVSLLQWNLPFRENPQKKGSLRELATLLFILLKGN